MRRLRNPFFERWARRKYGMDYSAMRERIVHDLTSRSRIAAETFRYRVDGGTSNTCFSSDRAAKLHGDGSARGRLFFHRRSTIPAVTASISSARAFLPALTRQNGF